MRNTEDNRAPCTSDTSVRTVAPELAPEEKQSGEDEAASGAEHETEVQTETETQATMGVGTGTNNSKDKDTAPGESASEKKAADSTTEAPSRDDIALSDGWSF